MTIGGLGRRQRWAPGPQARIDPSHPLSAGLVCYILSGHNVDLASKRLVTSAQQNGSTALGPAASFANAATDGFDLGNRSDLNFSAPFSAFVGMVPTASPSSYRHLFGRSNGSGSPSSWSWSLYLQNPLQPRFGGTGFFTITNAGGLTLNQYAQVGVVCTGGSHQMWIDNFPSGTASNATAYPSSLASSSSFWVGERTTDVGNLTVHAQIPWAAAWNRTLSAVEVRRLRADPFCMLTRGS